MVTACFLFESGDGFEHVHRCVRIFFEHFLNVFPVLGAHSVHLARFERSRAAGQNRNQRKEKEIFFHLANASNEMP